MFHTCLFDAVKLPHPDHPCKSAPSQTSFLTLDSASFLWLINHVNKVHDRASPQAVMASSALVPPLTEFPSMSSSSAVSELIFLSVCLVSLTTQLSQHARIAFVTTTGSCLI